MKRLYQVLYRKWRPERFSDVIGQEHVTTTLRNEISLGRIAHAYLFTGSRGTGKTSCAKILSRAVNCLDSENGEPCGKCSSCVGIANGSVMDVVEMDAASNNSVDDIRTILDEVVFTPSDAKYRVYIIDEVHMLSPSAYNALLKTLEEPPAHVVFILATTEINKIPATILSRCQRFDFSRIDAHDMADRLIQIAAAENVELQNDAALLIATVADGAMRDALSILDRCIGLSDTITAEIVRDATGLSGRDYLFTLTDSVIKGDIPLAINTVNDLHKASKSMSLLCEELSEQFRSLMLLKTMHKAAEPLIIMTADEMEKARQQADQLDLSHTVFCIEALQSAREQMFKGGNNKIELETCMIKLCSPRLSTDMSAIIARLEKLERTHISAAVTQPKSSQNEPAPQQPVVKNSAPAPSPVSVSSRDKIAELSAKAVPMEEWEDIIEAMKSITRVMATAFRGTKAYVSGNFVLIQAKDEAVLSHLRNPEQKNKVRAAIRHVTGRDFNLGPYRLPDEPANAPAPQKTKLDEFIENISNSDIELTVYGNDDDPKN